MSISTISAVKALFETSDTPTQSNFADLIDTTAVQSVSILIPTLTTSTKYPIMIASTAITLQYARVCILGSAYDLTGIEFFKVDADSSSATSLGSAVAISGHSDYFGRQAFTFSTTSVAAAQIIYMVATPSTSPLPAANPVGVTLYFIAT